MAMFKFLNTNKKMMILVIILFSINYSNQQYCSYNYNYNLTDYLSGNENEFKHKCFSLSNYFGNEKCCYNTDKNLCYKEESLKDPTDRDGNKFKVDDYGNKFDCPEIGPVPNNCGMAGVYQPLSNDTCIEISLVQGYCCYIKYTIQNDNRTACIRTKKLKKNNETSDDIIEFIKLIDNKDIDINSVKAECGNTNIKFYWTYSLILYIFFIIL